MTKLSIALAWIFYVLSILEGPYGVVFGIHQSSDAMRADCMATACFWVAMAIWYELRSRASRSGV